MSARQNSTLVIALVSLAFGTFFAIKSINAKSEENWPHVIGRITNSKGYFFVGRYKQLCDWRAKFDYEYYVDGSKYAGMTETIKKDKLEAVRAANQLPPETRIPVYYEPKHPAQSTIAPGQSFDMWIKLVFFCLALFIFSPALAFIVKEKK